MADWTYFNPVKVVFAPGALSRLADHVPFQRVVLVTSPGFTRRGVTDKVRQSLGKRLVHVLDDVKPNPDVRDIDDQAARIRELKPDCILALGGGSSMDTAKALAKLMTQPDTTSVTRHFRDGGTWQEVPALPVVTVPTTAGTGSEVTPFATVWDFEHHKKHSVSGEDLYAHTAILDPGLTLGLPEEVTISSGLDAISHAFESTWNRNANAVTLGFATKSLQLSLPALPRLHADGSDSDARADMMQASFLAGLAISQTKTAVAHSISYPLTTIFNLPHGFACSFTLPSILEFNAKHDDGRFKYLASVIGVDDIYDVRDMLNILLHDVDLRFFLDKYCGGRENIAGVIMNNFNYSRADNNMVKLTERSIRGLVNSSLQCFAIR